MAATAEEQANSRELGATSGRIGYLVTGAATEADARVAILAAAPSTFGGFTRRDATARVSDDIAGTWLGEATYGAPGAKVLSAGEVTISGTPGGAFQIRRCSETLSQTEVLACLLATGFGRTTHMTHGFELLGSYPASAPNFGGAINVKRNGDVQEVEGVDVPPGIQNDAAIQIAVNDFTLNLDKGECLFQGLSWQERSDGLWELAWDFSVMAGFYALEIDEITGINQPAWSYLWVFYETKSDDTAHCLVERAEGVYVHRVYDAVDFADLGTGCINSVEEEP